MSIATRRLTALALLVGPIIYLAAEFIAANAWTTPAYSYLTNWISDLGSTTQGIFQGRLISSPLHDVMNAGFIAQGVLFATGVISLSTSLPKNLRRFTVITGVAVGIGYLLLGVFHGTATAASDGSLAWHFTGAALAIIGANVLALVLGIHWWKEPATRRLAHASLPLGVIGLTATIVLMVTMNSDVPSGLIERLAVYPIVLFQVRAALHYLARINYPSPRSTTMPAEVAQPHGSPTRKAIAIAGDNKTDLAIVKSLIDAIGFDPVVAGTLHESISLEPRSELFGANFSADEVRDALDRFPETEWGREVAAARADTVRVPSL